MLSTETEYILLGGDLNLILDPKLDCDNNKHINNPVARKELLEIIEKNHLCDIYRKLNPLKTRYTWRRKNPVKQARLDYFIASSPLLDIISSCNIKPGYRSDHYILELNITLCNFKRGKEVWKFNRSLLKDKEYLIQMNIGPRWPSG